MIGSSPAGRRRRAPVLCIRLDDVHARTPVDLLCRLDAEVWVGRPVTAGVIPFPAPGCLGPRASAREVSGPGDTTANAPLMDYLRGRRTAGAVEVALHGVTHADHRVGSRMVAELVAARPPRVRRLLKVLHAWRALFDTRTLIPPHNYIDPAVLSTCLDGHAHVCRAITDGEVASLGLDPARSAQRAEAKRRMRYRFVGSQVDLYQTTGVSPERLSLFGNGVEEVARAILAVAVPVGVGTVTFHWWDFVSVSGTMDHEYGSAVRALLELLESHGAFFSTVSEFAAGCLHGRSALTR